VARADSRLSPQIRKTPNPLTLSVVDHQHLKHFSKAFIFPICLNVLINTNANPLHLPASPPRAPLPTFHHRVRPPHAYLQIHIPPEALIADLDTKACALDIIIIINKRKLGSTSGEPGAAGGAILAVCAGATYVLDAD
jgi:hypothetical protein